MALSRPGFMEVHARIYLGGRGVGQVGMTNGKPHLSGSNGSAVAILSSGGLRAMSGEIVDPLDSSFTIAWQYEGVEILIHEVFTAIIDAQATTAVHGRIENCDTITAYSATNETVLAITRKPKVRQLKYSQVSDALFLIMSDAIMIAGTFGEMSFTLSYRKIEIGTGVLFRPRPRAES